MSFVLCSPQKHLKVLIFITCAWVVGFYYRTLSTKYFQASQNKSYILPVLEIHANTIFSAEINFITYFYKYSTTTKKQQFFQTVMGTHCMIHITNNYLHKFNRRDFLCQENILYLFWLHKAGQSTHKKVTLFIFIFHFNIRTAFILSLISTVFPYVCEWFATQKLLQIQSDTFS